MFFYKNKSERTVPLDSLVRIAAAILAVMWMFRIFSFSSDVAEVSGSVSRSMTYNMIEKIQRHLGLDWDEAKIESVSRPVEKYLRKAAHMYEYAVLALLWGVVFFYCGKASEKYADMSRSRGHTEDDRLLSMPADKDRLYRLLSIAIPLMICLVYAMTDEFHQTFVDGRSGEVRDVLLDFGGAIIGLTILRAGLLLITKLRKR